MERPRRVWAEAAWALGLGALVASTGCRSMRSEVPPGKVYDTTGAAEALHFNSAPHPNSGIGGGLYSGPSGGPAGSVAAGGTAAAGGLPPGLGGAATTPAIPGGSPVYGTPGPNTPNLGAPTNNKFGPPAGTATPPPLGQY